MSEASHGRRQSPGAVAWSASRLRRHSDYQRVYTASRKQFSRSMTYFFAPRPDAGDNAPARVGLTAGRALGGAVERNRIKRRMREAVRKHWKQLPPGVDVILHPRRTALTMEFAALEREVGEIFDKVAARLGKDRAGKRGPGIGDDRTAPSGSTRKAEQ